MGAEARLCFFLLFSHHIVRSPTGRNGLIFLHFVETGELMTAEGIVRVMTYSARGHVLGWGSIVEVAFPL